MRFAPPFLVTPAKAGAQIPSRQRSSGRVETAIHGLGQALDHRVHWVPAFAGMTVRSMVPGAHREREVITYCCAAPKSVARRLSRP
jgi:hypothetical protein